ncbi:MAG: hypothetical protein ACF8LL_09205 [Phycisphaerales bacterium]
MHKLRTLLKDSPWIGWAVAGGFLLLSVVLYTRLSGGGGGAYSAERMSEMVTIKCVETGEEWEMTRGLMEQQLRRRGTELSPEEGLLNPSTGRPTGFPFDKGEWRETVERINREKQRAIESRGGG